MKSPFLILSLAVLTISLAQAQTVPADRTLISATSAGVSPQLASTGSTPLFLLPEADSGPGSVTCCASRLAIADLNGDGKLDLVNVDFQQIEVALGNGDGTFQTAKTTVVLPNTSTSQLLDIVVGDFNRDGKQDIALTGYSPNLMVLLGNGDGTFKAPVGYSVSTIRSLTSLATTDLNADGKLDLVVGLEDQVAVLLGNGNGTFMPAVTYLTNGSLGLTPPYVVGDINGDGHPDILTLSCYQAQQCAAASIIELLGNGDGTFQSPVAVSIPNVTTQDILLADVNHDGHLDVVTHTGVVLGNGNGTFQPIKYLTGGTYNPPLTAFDINGDGKLDLVSAPGVNSLAGEMFLNVFLGNGDGTFQPPQAQPLTLPGGIEALAVGDLNGDGKLDLAGSSNPATVVMLNNTGAPPTSVLVSPSVNPVNRGSQSVTYTATVSLLGGPLNGTVTFFDTYRQGGTTVGINLGTAQVANNKASVSTKYTLSPQDGSHAITAVYSGEYALAGGALSAALTEYVRSAISKTVLATSGSPSKVGQTVTFTATVTVNPKFGAVPNGETVRFTEGSKLLGTGTLSGGVAKFATNKLTAGTHHVLATYTGDTLFEPSHGGFPQVVQ